MTTAQLRTAARDAASLCAWQEAADLMDRAIEVYPAPRSGALARLDLDNMAKFRDAMRAQATQEAA
jgi:hypothetical protein